MRAASILIRTLDEAAALPETLDAVFAQSVRPHEVFVIDSGSRDGTLDVARRYPVRILELSPEKWSYPSALNLGARHATGEILVCLSAHCVPVHEHWLANLLRHFDDERVAGVWGPSLKPHRTPQPPGPPQRQEAGSYTVQTRMWGLSNANSAVRRSLWQECPFDERLPAAEDKAWGRELMGRGYCIVHDPAAAALHGRHTTGRAFQRNRAVMQGFRIMFPELDRATSGHGLWMLRAAWRAVLHRAAEPRPSLLWQDLKQGLSTLSALVGAYVGQRRSMDNEPRARRWPRPDRR